MAKRLNLFILVMLVLSQTILGPLASTSAVFAEGNGDGDKSEKSEKDSGEPKEVDKTALQDELDKEDDYAEDDYTGDSFAEFVNAISAGQDVVDDADATEEDVNDAVDAIQNAISALQEKKPEGDDDKSDKDEPEEGESGADKTDLEDLLGDVKEAKESEEGIFTEESFEDFLEAVDAGKSDWENVLNDDDATQEDVDQAVSEIEAALGLLAPNMQTMADTPDAKEFKDDDLTFAFDKIVIDGQEITKTEDADGLEFAKGADVTLSYTFEIKASEDYGPGSYFTFDLPTSLLDYDASNLQGTFGNEDGNFSYKTNGNTVTVTLEDAPLYGGLEFEDGELDFDMKLGDNGAEDGLDQELEIPVKGSETITIPLTYKPSSSNKKMNKEGTPEVLQDGTRVINWTVWVNESGKDLKNAEVDDNPFSQNHELDGDITVKKYIVNIDGSTEADGSSTATKFPVNLDDGRYAYELTYQTKVTVDATQETETYWNQATLSDENNDDDIATNSATHNYGKKLEKKIETYDKYQAKWGVKYNYFGKKFDTIQELTDTLEGPHTFVDGSVNVYPVDVDLEGKGTPDKGSPIQNPDFEISTDGKTLTVNLDSPNGEAYYIEYETEHDQNEEGYITDGNSVKNKVEYDGNDDEETLNIQENIFKKERGNIDFANKLVTWRLTVNPERDVKDFTITDLFENYTEGGTRQTLVNFDGSTSLDLNNLSNVFTNLPSNSSATLQGDETEGFELKLGNLQEGSPFTIEYKTKLDFQSSGASYDEYKNTAEAKWKHPTTDEEYKVEKEANYTPDGETAANGYKNGEFDHVEQVFNWNLAVNITKQDINGAKVVDEINDGHILIKDSIEVHKLELDINNQTGTKGDPVGLEVYEITESDKDGFTLEFEDNLGSNNNEAYIITYQTEDDDEVIGQKDGSNEYGNEATFTTNNGGEFDLKASTKVKNANELIDKDVDINNADETITWTIDVNKSHSELGNIILTDKPSDNQLILEDTFKKREIEMDESGNVSYGSWEDIDLTSVDHDDNTFTIDLGNLDQKGYQIEYTTFFQGADGDEFSNEASIDWEGVSTGTTTESDVGQIQFLYASSSGSISSSKGRINLKKIGLNPVTGEYEPLEGIEFHLKTINGKYKLGEATTDADGKLEMEDVRYGTYQLEEINPDTDKYLPLNENPTSEQNKNSITITMNDDLNGKEFTVENIEDIPEDPDKVCPAFTITVKDIDGNEDSNQPVKLVNERTGEIIEVTTDDNGQIKEDREDLPAGKYIVYEDGGTGNEEDDIYIGGITVNYDKEEYEDCSATVGPEKKSVSGEKIWKDGGLDNDNRPDSITIKLLADGDEVNSVKLTKLDASSDNENVWEYEFKNLRKLNNAGTKEIEYTVEETDVGGYNSTVEGYDITNVRTSNSTIEIPVEKVWEGPEVEKEEVTINLLADGEKEDELTLSENNGWEGSFKDLAIYNAEGEEIKYTVEEIEVGGYNTKTIGSAEDGFTVTNTQKTYAIGDYVWVDYNNDGTQNESSDAALEGVTVELYKEGEEDTPFKTTTTNDEGLYIFDELLAGEYQVKFILTEEQEKKYKFTKQNQGDAEEDSDADVETGLTKKIELNDENDYLTTDYDAQGFKATEGIDPTWDAGVIELTEVTVNKTWVDDNDATEDRPKSIKVNLKQGDKVIKSDVEIKADDNDEWTYTFTDLPRYFEEGTEYEYTVTEHDVAGYATEIDKFEITNTRADTKDIEITKSWLDDNDATEDRPDEIEVELFRSVEDGDGEFVNTYTIKPDSDEEDSNVWSFTIEELDSFDTEGKAYTYTVEEVGLKDEYESKVDGFDITNTRVGKTKFSGTKTWEDNDNKAEQRPKSITVNLFADGKPVEGESAEVTAEDDWTYTFSDLEKFDENGAEITYSVDEEEVPKHYEKSIDESGLNITNTIISYAIGDYTWIDRNKDGIQDENEEILEGVIVELINNDGEVIRTTETDDQGLYIFDNLVAGDYQVKFTLTDKQAKKYKFTKQDGGDATENSDADANGYTTKITLNDENEYLTTDYDAQDFDASEGIDPTWDAGVIELTDVSGEKVWVNDHNESEALPKSITVNLLANGAEVGSQEVTAEDDWTYSFQGLDKYDETGEKITYSVTEDAVDGYETSYDGNNITNTKVCESFTVEVEDEEGKPVTEEEYTFESEDGEKITKKTDKDGKITFDREDLPEGKYTVKDKDGNKVGEIDVKYNVDCEDNVTKVIVPVEKPEDPKTCEEIEITVTEDGKPSKENEYTFTSADGKTKITFTTDKDGKVTIDRDKLPNGKYTVTDKDGNVVGTVEITDSCEVELNIKPTKDTTEPTQPEEKEDGTTPSKPSEEDKGSTGGFLPKTATNTFNLLLAGGLLLVAGTGFTIFRRRKIE